MSISSLDPTVIVGRALDFVTRNPTIEKFLIQLGLDPSNTTYDVIFDRIQEIAIANVTFSNILALAGAVFLLSTFVVRTIVLMRVLCIFSIIFFLGSAALAHSIPKFLMYLLALPINIVRLVQIRNVVKKARIAAEGTLSLDWLRPFMTPRDYQKGDVLFRKDDAGTEMFLTVTGKFLVTEISVEIQAGRMLGELGFISPKNKRTQSVACIESGEVLTISYEKLLTIYFQNPTFGYFFLRLISDRLIQNLARLEGLIETDKTKLLALTAAKSGSVVASEQLLVQPSLAARLSKTKDQITLQKRQNIKLSGNGMFDRLRKIYLNALGAFFYWIGWTFAVFALVGAIILVVITANPLAPLFLGGIGLIIWAFAVVYKYILARRALR